MNQKSVKIDVVLLEKLAKHGDTPNRALGNLLGNPVGNLDKNLGNPKVSLGNLKDTFETKKSVADLRDKFNIILKDINSKIQDTRKRQDNMQEEFNERVNKVVSFHVSNTIERLIDNKINKLREELKRA